jgi:hypothetical protein
MTSPTERSIPELFSDAMAQLAKLVGNEFALARAEMAEKTGQAGRAAAMIGAGAVVMIPALVLLLFVLPDRSSSAMYRNCRVRRLPEAALRKIADSRCNCKTHPASAADLVDEQSLAYSNLQTDP